MGSQKFQKDPNKFYANANLTLMSNPVFSTQHLCHILPRSCVWGSKAILKYKMHICIIFMVTGSTSPILHSVMLVGILMDQLQNKITFILFMRYSHSRLVSCPSPTSRATSVSSHWNVNMEILWVNFYQDMFRLIFLNNIMNVISKLSNSRGENVPYKK